MNPGSLFRDMFKKKRIIVSRVEISHLYESPSYANTLYAVSLDMKKIFHKKKGMAHFKLHSSCGKGQRFSSIAWVSPLSGSISMNELEHDGFIFVRQGVVK